MVVNVLLVIDVKFVMAAALSLVLEWRFVNLATVHNTILRP